MQQIIVTNDKRGKKKRFMHGRNEWKFIVQEDEFNLIDFRLSSLLERDNHCNEYGFYNVRSLYFDYPSNKCASDVETGNSTKYKFRIRYYEDNTDKLYLEKKIKKNNICYKKSCLIDKKIFDDIINSRIESLLYKKDLLDEFAIEIIKNSLRPKIIVDYRRRAYCELISNTRITFDDNIKVSNKYENFLDGSYDYLQLGNRNERVMEIKFDRLLPPYIKKACTMDSIFQTSFSKYFLGYMLMHGGKTNEHYKYY